MDFAVEYDEENKGGHPRTMVFKTWQWTIHSDNVCRVDNSYHTFMVHFLLNCYMKILVRGFYTA